VILNVDFSQGELRIAACLANEITMIKAYQKGIDLHLLTGLGLWNIQNPNNAFTLAQALDLMKAEDKNIKLVRQGGKAGNFGLLYGMQVLGFLSYAWNTYKVALTEHEGEKFRNSFFDRYPRLPKWHENYINMAHSDGQVRSPLGRIRHLPLVHSNDWKVKSAAERQGINAPVQSTLSDMGLLAASILNKLYPDLWIFGFTHDALSFYVPEDEAVYWATNIKEVMENLPLGKFGWKPQLNFPVDVEIGTNMGDMKGLKLAA
jgi:DNA polymerase I-like protein with 3'-5' exonuclease and polymerase domains